MSLDARARFPTTLSYVLKLERPARAAPVLTGRIEQLTTGRVRVFRTADELVACLTADLAEAASRATDAPSAT